MNIVLFCSTAKFPFFHQSSSKSKALSWMNQGSLLNEGRLKTKWMQNEVLGNGLQHACSYLQCTYIMSAHHQDIAFSLISFCHIISKWLHYQLNPILQNPLVVAKACTTARKWVTMTLSHTLTSQVHPYIHSYEQLKVKEYLMFNEHCSS